MIEILTAGMRDDVVAISAHGKVDHNDYRSVITPAIEQKLKGHPKIRFLYHTGEDFKGYSVEALWDDAALGVRHWTAFEKVAVVTDVDWIRNSVAFFRFLIPCPVRIFRNDELTAAAEWINA